MRKKDYTAKELKVIGRRLEVSAESLRRAAELMEEFNVEKVHIDEDPAARVAKFANQAMGHAAGE